MPDIRLLSITSSDRVLLMRLTAEMLALPFRVCLSRDCRRALACRYRRVRSGEPACLAHLDATEREAFDQLLTLVLKTADTLPVASPARNADTRALEEAAIEIILAAQRRCPHLAHLFPAWLTRYRAAGLGSTQVQAASNG